jgi:hypothetical protein
MALLALAIVVVAVLASRTVGAFATGSMTVTGCNYQSVSHCP